MLVRRDQPGLKLVHLGRDDLGERVRRKQLERLHEPLPEDDGQLIDVAPDRVRLTGLEAGQLVLLGHRLGDRRRPE